MPQRTPTAPASSTARTRAPKGAAGVIDEVVRHFAARAVPAIIMMARSSDPDREAWDHTARVDGEERTPWLAFVPGPCKVVGECRPSRARPSSRYRRRRD
jgi:hypothetical protein